MNGLYRHKKGNVYKVICVAKHSETLEEFVIYQDVNDKQKVWARPIDMFLEKDRFTKISRQKATAKDFITKYHFPNIEFSSNIPNLIKSGGGFSKSVKAMITLLTKRELVDNSTFENLENDDDLERFIFEKVRTFKPYDNLEEIFHLIQIWGGSTGRVIYVAKNKFNWGNIEHQYQRLVDICMSVHEVNDTTISLLVDAVSKFDASVQNIGVSFITKHTRYWLHKTLGDNTLPIYDSIMANYVMQKKMPSIKHLAEYWNAMMKKATDLNITLNSLERQTFIYAYEFIRQKEIR